ncbi:MAG: hypothetical protein AAB426_10875 [Myxococcota bacterium]
MTERAFRSGWFEDVASAVALGVTPIIVAVCESTFEAEQAAAWVESSLRSQAPWRTVRIGPNEVPEGIAATLSEHAKERVAVLVLGATNGTDEAVRERWSQWNVARERLRDTLRASSFHGALVLFAVAPAMVVAVDAAPDLLAVAQVISVDTEPFRVTNDDPSVGDVFRLACQQLESAYGITTREVLSRLRRREATGVSADDLRRWKAIAAALRDPEPS